MVVAAQEGKKAAEIFGSDRMWGLKELPLPDPVNWWPQTSGWFLLGSILIVSLLAFGWQRWRRYQRNAYRRQGIVALDQIAKDHRKLGELPFLLRKSALAISPRREVAALRGTDWIAWLNSRAGQELFRKSDSQILDMLAFKRSNEINLNKQEAQKLIQASQHWMRYHRG